ncbi:zinc finger protein 629-like [Galendromus occidentalis]|uniref:Zinc finger protein 629-like n=1 Tax=Galendromus occidentalis TaxID=34638 RepID=A0AAJ7SFD9_9ACAR|nr:zinc finger protein 629-like [Galendromus occidentalis]
MLDLSLNIPLSPTTITGLGLMSAVSSTELLSMTVASMVRREKETAPTTNIRSSPPPVETSQTVTESDKEPMQTQLFAIGEDVKDTSIVFKRKKRLDDLVDRLSNSSAPPPKKRHNSGDIKSGRSARRDDRVTSSEDKTESDVKLFVADTPPASSWSPKSLYTDSMRSPLAVSPLYASLEHLLPNLMKRDQLAANFARRDHLLRHQSNSSLESVTSTPQDSPLDLSVRKTPSPPSSAGHTDETLRTSSSPTTAFDYSQTPLQLQFELGPLLGISPPFYSTPPQMKRRLSPTQPSFPLLSSSASSASSAETSPVEENQQSYACSICGQTFSLHDRLAKHIASRHRNKNSSPELSSTQNSSSTSSSGRSYTCDICGRSFARSDMLTRHMRLHTGVKPYTCKVCGQVFSRSDHLSTHQRTHTGEKPYKCPQCPYAACRRDMITRHMRTHARYQLPALPDSSSSSLEEEPLAASSPVQS